MRRIVILLATALVVVACGDSASVDTSTSSTTRPTPTAPPTTTTTTPPTTTTSQASTTTTALNTTTTTDPVAPMGSGCTPGQGDLPDGDWYGVVADFDADGIGFDLACLFVGEAAVAASAEDGDPEPPPNDYYVRNQNDLLRDLTVAADTPATWYASGDLNFPSSGTYAEWVDYLEVQGPTLGVWVTISEGEVIEVAEWWVP